MSVERAAFERALEEAARGLFEVEPNPKVGAVAVQGGEIRAVGFHAGYGKAHAEVDLIERLGAGTLAGHDVYVTLEPCSHHGKTPPCTEALIAARPERVVVLAEDRNPAVAGRGMARLREAGLEAVLSEDVELRQREHELNSPYRAHRERERAWIIAKWAMTLDGKIASRSRDSRWISSEVSRREVHRLRASVDAIVAGIGTALQDDPQLTPRDVDLVRRPARVVLDSRGRLPVTARLFAGLDRYPLLVFTTQSSPGEWRQDLTERGAEVSVLSDREGHVDLEEAFTELRRQHRERVLLEGGSEVLGAAFDAELIDQVEVYVCPRLVGGQDAPTPWPGRGRATMDQALSLEHVRWERLEDDQRLRAFVS